MPPSGDALSLAERLVEACPAPALLVRTGGSIGTLNGAARRAFGIAEGSNCPPLPQLLGIGWREASVLAWERETDLVADLPPSSPLPERRGARVRLEPIAAPDGRGLAALVAFVELPASPAVGTHARATARTSGFDALFGSDPALVATKSAAERFARTQLPILLLSETGTGKELLARAIHAASPRRDRPFVAINCGALSPQLLESELFGYAPGAFTGASRDGNEGKIGAARGGTLFLDEVAEMPAPLQALLLRVLEDGTYYRVGESRPRHADVRLLCATGRDLPRMVSEGAFRHDLYFRIHGACLTLPPVRERNDLPELVDHLLAALAREQGRERAPRLDFEARGWLLGLPWPGNIRQLRTALRHALILTDGDEIGLEHLPRESAVLLTPAAVSARTEESRPASPGRARPAATLRQLERDRLRAAVEAAQGNLTRAAEHLGIARSTLYRRLRRHGLLAGEGEAS